MVKGISKQVILVKPQDEALFEQAIFIVRDGVTGVTEQELLRQARDATRGSERERLRWGRTLAGFCSGGGLVGLLWLISWIL